MSKKYPNVVFFRYDKYLNIDSVVNTLDCNIKITSEIKEIEKLYSLEYHVLVTYGPDSSEYNKDVHSVISERLRARWIHYSNIEKGAFEKEVNFCYMDNVVKNRVQTRPVFSAFTTCFNSFWKIDRPYLSLKAQTELDWEWVIVDDSTDETHFTYLKDKFKDEPKIRLYNRMKNSGIIGEVKNEAIGLCRGEFILELDHDDEVTPDLIKDTIYGFKKYPDVDFIYMDFINLNEDLTNYWYGDFICKGYGGYYHQYYEEIKKWVAVYSTPQINNITASYIFCLPNHPRIWRREKLMQLGSYSEFLPIIDDQEILLRTITETRVLKMSKMAYIQYMNANGSNFSLIRNSEINRLGPEFLTPQFKEKYGLDKRMRDLDAWHDIAYDYNAMQIWKRDGNFKGNYANYLCHPDYDKQYCIIGLDAVRENVEMLKDLAKNPRNDFIVLDNQGENEVMFSLLEAYNFKKFKCYILRDTDNNGLVNYFERIYKSVDDYEIIF